MNPRGPSTQDWVLLALGSNLGSSSTTIQKAIQDLISLVPGPVEVSRLWVSTPVDCPPNSPEFVNGALVFPVPARWTPERWLRQTQALETKYGRRPKTIHNEARPLDLDLIAWGSELRNNANLVLPHPRAHERRFVLQPLAELVPDFILPGQPHTIAQLLAKCRVDLNFRLA